MSDDRKRRAVGLESGAAESAKRAAIEAFQQAFEDMATRLQALSPAQLDRPIWTGEGEGWRIRDLLPHFARWQRMAAQAARLIAGGTEPPPEQELLLRTFVGLPSTVDEVNEKAHADWRDRSLDEQLGEMRAAHAALIDALRVLPAARVVKDDGEPYRYFWQPGLNHLHQHRAHIEAALKETQTP